MHSVTSTADGAKLFAATVALFAGQDVEIAANTASTAIDNNFLVLAAYGVAAASVAYSAYNIYNAYQEGGAEAALKQLGIEIAFNAGGLIAGKVVFKIGSVSKCKRWSTDILSVSGW